MYQRGDRTIITIAFLLFIAAVACGCFILGGCNSAPRDGRNSGTSPRSARPDIVTNQIDLSDDLYDRYPQKDEISAFGPPEAYEGFDVFTEPALEYVWSKNDNTRSAEPQEASDSHAIKEDVYHCRRTTEEIHLDGRLDESAWSRAEIIETWFWLDSSRRQPTVQTRARLLWDRRYLYIAFECQDEDVWSFTDQDDGDLWNGDVVELFLKPSKGKPVYYEWEFAPNRTLFDARYPHRTERKNPANRRWDSGAHIACRVNGTADHREDQDTGWIIEAAIPLLCFSQDVSLPREGTLWTFAVCRYDYSQRRDNPKMTLSSPGAKDGFHSSEVYKTIHFSK